MKRTTVLQRTMYVTRKKSSRTLSWEWDLKFKLALHRLCHKLFFCSLILNFRIPALQSLYNWSWLCWAIHFAGWPSRWIPATLWSTEWQSNYRDNKSFQRKSTSDSLWPWWHSEGSYQVTFVNFTSLTYANKPASMFYKT